MRRRRLLRLSLADRAGAAPRALRFLSGPWGKPALEGPGPAFSVSHSGPHVLITLSDAWELGCDIERLDPAFDWRVVAAADIFAAGEREALARTTSEATRAALGMWTMKEAVLKCLGLGLAVAGSAVDTLRGGPFQVASAPPVSAAPLDLDADLAAAVAWRPR